MARNRKRLGNMPQQPDNRSWFRGPDPKEVSAYSQEMSRRAEREAYNAKVAERRRMMAGVPNDMNNEFTRGLGDTFVDARGAVRNINTPAAVALGAGGAVAGLAGLNAYYQQGAEGLATDGFNVAGRAVNNAMAGLAGGVGIDPLAQARNNVRDAGSALGSANLLEAVAADELMAMDEITQAANSSGGAPEIQAKDEGAFQAQVMQVANQLMETDIMTADGPRPMNYDVAINRAIDIVSGDYRAAGIL